MSFFLFMARPFNKTISTQVEFDALTIEQGDRIKLNGSFVGTIDVDQTDVLINGGTLLGGEDISGETWTDEGGGIYSINIGQEVKWLFIDGQTPKLADFGVTDLDSLIGTDQISVNTGVTSVIGAYCSNRNYKWARTRGIKVTGQSEATKTLEYDRSIDDRSWVTIGSAVSTMDGKVNFYGLDTFISDNFDWAYTDKLYLKLPSAPSNYTIYAVTEDQAINVTAQNCSVENVTIKKYHRAGIQCNKSNLSVSGCNISEIREHGIRVNTRSYNLTISQNTIYDCDCNGIYVEGAANINITDNTVYNIGVGVNDSWLKDSYDVSIMIGIGIECAISTNFTTDDSEYISNFNIWRNTVYNTLWCGIHTYRWTGGTIRYNHLYNTTGKDYEDAAAIYGARQLEPFTPPDTTPTIGTGEVSYNIIHDIVEGITGQRHGIYMDNGSASVDVHHNVVYNHDGGPCGYINQGSKLTKFRNNIFQGDKYDTQRIFNSLHTFGPENYGHVFTNNIFAQLTSTKHCWLTDGDGASPFASGGSSDNNYYLTPYAANRVASPNKGLSAWRSTWNTDAGSTVKENWLSFVSQSQAREDIKVYTNPTSTDTTVTIPAGYEDTGGNDISGTEQTIQAWYGYVAIKSS